MSGRAPEDVNTGKKMVYLADAGQLGQIWCKLGRFWLNSVGCRPSFARIWPDSAKVGLMLAFSKTYLIKESPPLHPRSLEGCPSTRAAHRSLGLRLPLSDQTLDPDHLRIPNVLRRPEIAASGRNSHPGATFRQLSDNWVASLGQLWGWPESPGIPAATRGEQLFGKAR